MVQVGETTKGTGFDGIRPFEAKMEEREDSGQQIKTIAAKQGWMGGREKEKGSCC